MKKSNSLLSVVPPNTELYFRKNHLKLNQSYHTQIYGDLRAHLLLEEKRSEIKKFETTWMNQAKSECYKKYHCDRSVKNPFLVELALRDHPVFHHALFDYLCYEADLQAFKSFLLSEAILNFEFFDYLTLALVGATDLAKAEITANLWDEAGRGDLQKFHTQLFANLIKDLDLVYEREAVLKDLSWEALAGINLFAYCASYSYNKMLYFGLLAATELLDPPHYKKLLQGMRRLFKTKRIDSSYYIEHETIDIEHAEGWLRKVILPELERDPRKTREFWLGFYLRLDSAKCYYDRLLQLLSAKQAA